MKKSILIMSVGMFLFGVTMTSCNNKSDDVEDAQENADEAAKELKLANKEYLADMEMYKKEATAKIESNQQSIIDFNKRIANEKKEARAEYQKKIDALDKKNSDLKKRMEDYQADGNENWEIFKAEFNREMDELGTAFKDFFGVEITKK